VLEVSPVWAYAHILPIQCQSAHNYMAEHFNYWAGIHNYIKDVPVAAIEGMQVDMVLGED
jgi:hypothetical protein